MWAPTFSSALSVGPEWVEYQRSIFLLSPHHLHRTRNDMGLREILRLPKRNRKVRSKTRSEISPIDGPSNDNQGVPRPADSTPDLGIGRSTLPPPAPFTSPDQESKGMSTDLSSIIHLITFCSTVHRAFRFGPTKIRFQRRAKQGLGILKSRR